MVGNDDGGRSGFLRLERALDGHDALDDEGTACQCNDLLQLGHALAARRRSHVLQEGQTGSIHIHGNGKAAAGLGLVHLGLDRVDVPGLDGGYTAAACRTDGLGGHGHDVGVGAVAGKGGDTVLRAGTDQHIVIGHIGVGVRVVEVHRADRACEEGQAEALAEQLHMGVGGAVLAQGVHVDPDVGPLIIIADGCVTHALGTGAGDLVFAGHAVAHRAGLAILADVLPSIAQNV